MRDAVTEMNPHTLTSYEDIDAIYSEQHVGMSDGYRDAFDKSNWVNPHDMDPGLIIDGFFGSNETTQEEIDEADIYELFPWGYPAHDSVADEAEYYKLCDRYEEHADEMTRNPYENISDFAGRWAEARYASQYPELFSNVSFESQPIRVEDDWDIIVPDPVQIISDRGLEYDSYEHLPLRGKCLDQDRELPGCEQEHRGNGVRRQPYHKGRKHARNVEQRHIRRCRKFGKLMQTEEVLAETKHDMLLGLVMDEEFINDMMDYYAKLDHAYHAGEFERGPWDEAFRYEEFYSETLDTGCFDRLHDDYCFGAGSDGFWYSYPEEEEEKYKYEDLKFQLLDSNLLGDDEDFNKEEDNEVPDCEYDCTVTGNAVGRRAQIPVRVRF